MRCIHPTQSLALDGDMAPRASRLSEPLFSEPAQGTGAGCLRCRAWWRLSVRWLRRRSPSPSSSAPRRSRRTRGQRWRLLRVNAAFVLFLIALVGREVHRIVMARRRGKAASRLHVRIVAMFALVAAIPAIMVAIIASITLDIGLDRWFEIRTKTIVNSSLSIADAYVQENARNLQGTTLSMAYDLDASRTLYGLDRTGFLDLMNKEAVGRVAGPCGADQARRFVRHERQDRCRFRHAGAAGRRRDQRRRRQAGADRAEDAQHHGRHRQAAPDRRALSLHHPPGRSRSDQGASDRQVQHRRISRPRRQPPHLAGGLRTALSVADADHHPVRDLDRHRGGRPAGAADPPAYRRGRRGRDRQSRRCRAGSGPPTATSPRSATPSTRCCWS